AGDDDAVLLAVQRPLDRPPVVDLQVDEGQSLEVIVDPAALVVVPAGLVKAVDARGVDVADRPEREVQAAAAAAAYPVPARPRVRVDEPVKELRGKLFQRVEGAVVEALLALLDVGGEPVVAHTLPV